LKYFSQAATNLNLWKVHGQKNSDHRPMAGNLRQSRFLMTDWHKKVGAGGRFQFLWPVVALSFISFAVQTGWAETPVACYTYAVKAAFPHDTGAFTQGLVYHRGCLYESTGLNANSSIRKVALQTGKVLQIRHLDSQHFGEGLTIMDQRIFQLSWTSGIGWIYDLNSFDPLCTFSYPTQGWGLTHDGQLLIMSDGSALLHFLDPQTLKTAKTIEVRDRSGPIAKLNELEYVEGEIYANIWGADTIARIAPDSGKVVGWIDLSGLLPEKASDRPVDVLNGIAYDAESKRLFVTGKWWPRVFEIELVRSAAPCSRPF
jgi:glutamine cyclotransferase